MRCAVLFSGMATLGGGLGSLLHFAVVRHSSQNAPFTHLFNLHKAKAVPVAASSSELASAGPTRSELRLRSLTALRIQLSSVGSPFDLLAVFILHRACQRIPIGIEEQDERLLRRTADGRSRREKAPDPKRSQALFQVGENHFVKVGDGRSQPLQVAVRVVILVIIRLLWIRLLWIRLRVCRDGVCRYP